MQNGGTSTDRFAQDIAKLNEQTTYKYSVIQIYLKLGGCIDECLKISSNSMKFPVGGGLFSNNCEHYKLMKKIVMLYQSNILNLYVMQKVHDVTKCITMTETQSTFKINGVRVNVP